MGLGVAVALIGAALSRATSGSVASVLFIAFVDVQPASMNAHTNTIITFFIMIFLSVHY